MNYFFKIIKSLKKNKKTKKTENGESRLIKSAIRRLEHHEEYYNAINNYKSNKLAGKNKIVVFTAIVDQYDTLKMPEYINDQYDYIVFTDCEIEDSGIWQIRPITYFDEDPTKTARYIKTHPHILLSEYDIAIWIDANIMIINNFHDIIDNFISSGLLLGAIPHPNRNSIYEEISACRKRNKDNLKIMELQVKKYKSENFFHDDLIETNLMIFLMHNNKLIDFLNLWWNEIHYFSRRDQLSINYALYKTNIIWHRIMDKPYSARNHPSFAYIAHDMNTGPSKILNNNLHFKKCDPYSGESYSQAKEKILDDQSKTDIDIIIYIHNNPDQAKKCLDSVNHKRTHNNQRAIIIDDASNNQTQSFLKESASQFEWVTLLHNQEIQGYAKSINKGLSTSKSDFIIILDCSSTVTDGWAEKMADAAFSNKGIGIVGTMTDAAGYLSIPCNNFSADHMNKLCEQWSTAEILPRVLFINSFCFGITRALLNSIGFLNENINDSNQNPVYEYCFMASSAGFEIVIATNTYVANFFFEEKSKPTDTDKTYIRASKSFDANKILTNIQNKGKDYIALYDKLSTYISE